MEILKGDFYYRKLNALLDQYIDFFIEFPEKKHGELETTYRTVALSAEKARLHEDKNHYKMWDDLLKEAEEILEEEKKNAKHSRIISASNTSKL